MHVLTDKEVPEYEIHPTELDFSNSVKISKVSSSLAQIYLLLFSLAFICCSQL